MDRERKGREAARRGGEGRCRRRFTVVRRENPSPASRCRSELALDPIWDDPAPMSRAPASNLREGTGSPQDWRSTSAGLLFPPFAADPQPPPTDRSTPAPEYTERACPRTRPPPPPRPPPR